ncbi:unnamed protein product [Camellia sinensis]
MVSPSLFDLSPPRLPSHRRRSSVTTEPPLPPHLCRLPFYLPVSLSLSLTHTHDDGAVALSLTADPPSPPLLSSVAAQCSLCLEFVNNKLIKSSFFPSPLMGLRCAIFSVLIFLVCITVKSQQNQASKIISLGFSLSLTNPPTFWPSPSGLFAFGFYTQHTGFKVGIWLVGNNGNITIVWTANRDDPPITSNSTLELTRSGKLVLRTEEHRGEEKLIANTTGSAASASMLDSGNFVLYNDTQQPIWQSFDFPTDTILGGQNLSMDMRLYKKKFR